MDILYDDIVGNTLGFYNWTPEKDLKPTKTQPKGTTPEIDEVICFMLTLDEKGQRSMLDFIRGAKFMQSAMSSSQTPPQALHIPEGGPVPAACPAP